MPREATEVGEARREEPKAVSAENREAAEAEALGQLTGEVLLRRKVETGEARPRALARAWSIPCRLTAPEEALAQLPQVEAWERGDARRAVEARRGAFGLCGAGWAAG